MLYEIQGWYDGYKELQGWMEDWLDLHDLHSVHFYLDEFGGGHFEVEFDYLDEWAINMMNTLEDDFPDIEVTNLA